MTDPVNTLPWERFAYLITDQPCPHCVEPFHKGDCSLCVRDVLAQVATWAAKREREWIADEVERFKIGVITREDLPKYIAAHVRSQLC